MNRNLRVVIVFSLAVTCGGAAKSTAPVPVPLPRNNPLGNAEQQNQQNSMTASALFSEKKLPSLGRSMAIAGAVAVRSVSSPFPPARSVALSIGGL